MRSLSSSSFIICLFLLALFYAPVRADIQLPSDEAAKLLPDQAGDFRARGIAHQPQNASYDYLLRGDDVVSAAVRDYANAKGEKFRVLLIKTRTDSAAYSLLTTLTLSEYKSPVVIQISDVGTASVSAGYTAFYKGSALVTVSQTSAPHNNSEAEKTLARSLAETLDKGEGEPPVLVKHLPDWEKAQERAIYVVSLERLQNVVGHHPALSVIDFTGGTEAVIASYDPSRLVIVEFNTPQLAGDNDTRIKAKIDELRASGQSLPTAYRRVGNYAVFVFDAPDEQTAKRLIDSISYEQVVRWLGPNPHAIEEAQRQYVQTTAGVIVSVLKASGLSLILCLGIGGLFGALMFRRRRTQQATADAYTDAGGMMRLNLDNITKQNDPARLLGQSSATGDRM